jgi:hypothetical protein
MQASKELRFYYPSPKFPSVSITGSHCDLMCNHCKGHYLHNMHDVHTPKKLRDFCITHDADGGVGILVSGGSTKEGKVPIEPFLGTIRWVKNNTDLIVNIHTGMLNKREAEDIAATEVDIISVDLVGSRKTLKQVYGLDASVEMYMGTLSHLKNAGVSFLAPHICVGLHYGEVLGEQKALEMAINIRPDVFVFTSIIPTVGTPMEKVQSPRVNTITDFIKEAKRRSKGTDISLGCMRSRENKIELEKKAIKAGASRIALASRSTENWALEQGYNVKKINGCCVIPRSIENELGL